MRTHEIISCTVVCKFIPDSGVGMQNCIDGVGDSLCHTTRGCRLAEHEWNRTILEVANTALVAVRTRLRGCQAREIHVEFIPTALVISPQHLTDTEVAVKTEPVATEPQTSVASAPNKVRVRWYS